MRKRPILETHGRDLAGEAETIGVRSRIRNEFGTVVQTNVLTGNPAIVFPVLLAAQTEPRSRLIYEIAPIQRARRAPPSANQHRWKHRRNTFTGSLLDHVLSARIDVIEAGFAIRDTARPTAQPLHLRFE